MSSDKASFNSKDPGTGDSPGTVKNDGAATSKKASFYSRDLAPLSSDAANPGKKKYMAEERRRENRRKGQSRRTDVRFDPTKTDRRQTDGRRENDATVKFW
jgi:hypothetical protein